LRNIGIRGKSVGSGSKPNILPEDVGGFQLHLVVIVPPVTSSLSLLKFDKIWPFYDFSGADQRSVYLGKGTA
jgi:hypothetical protein